MKKKGHLSKKQKANLRKKAYKKAHAILHNNVPQRYRQVFQLTSKRAKTALTTEQFNNL